MSLLRKTLPAVFLLALAALAVAVSLWSQSVQYESRGKRDPFMPLVGIDRPAVTRLEDVASIDDLKLEGIALGAQGRRAAMLNGQVVREHEKVGEVELQKIDEKSITVLIGGKAYEIFLAGEEGGAKGGKR